MPPFSAPTRPCQSRNRHQARKISRFSSGAATPGWYMQSRWDWMRIGVRFGVRVSGIRGSGWGAWFSCRAGMARQGEASPAPLGSACREPLLEPEPLVRPGGSRQESRGPGRTTVASEVNCVGLARNHLLAGRAFILLPAPRLASVLGHSSNG